jgi:hypothetical protein
MLIEEERPDFLYKYMSASRAAHLIETLRLYMSPGAVLNDLYDFNIRGFWQEDEDTKYRIFVKRMLQVVVRSLLALLDTIMSN